MSLFEYNVQEGKVIFHQSAVPGEGMKNAFDQYWFDILVDREDDISRQQLISTIDSLGGDPTPIQNDEIIDDETINEALLSLVGDTYANVLPGGDASLGNVTLSSGIHTYPSNQLHQFRNLTLQNGAILRQSGSGNRLVLLVKETLTLHGTARIEWYSEPGNNGTNGSSAGAGAIGGNASGRTGGNGGTGNSGRTGGTGGDGSRGKYNAGGGGTSASGREGGGGGGGGTPERSGGAGGTQAGAGNNGANGSHGTTNPQTYNSTYTKYSQIISIIPADANDNATTGGTGLGGGGGAGGAGGSFHVFGAGGGGGGGGAGRAGTGSAGGKPGKSAACVYIEARNIVVSPDSRISSKGGSGGSAGVLGTGGSGNSGGSGTFYSSGSSRNGWNGSPGGKGGNGGTGGHGSGGNGGLVFVQTRSHNIVSSNIDISGGTVSSGGNPGNLGHSVIIEH